MAWPPSSLLHSSKNVPVWWVPLSFGYDEISIIDEPILHPATHCGRDKSNGLMQKRCNSSALALELRLFCLKPSILSLCSANDRWRYTVTLSLIGLAHAQNAPCCGLYMTLYDSIWHYMPGLLPEPMMTCQIDHHKILHLHQDACCLYISTIVIEVREKRLFTKFKWKFSVIAKHTQGLAAWHEPVLKQLMVIPFFPQVIITSIHQWNQCMMKWYKMSNYGCFYIKVG